MQFHHGAWVPVALILLLAACAGSMPPQADRAGEDAVAEARPQQRTPAPAAPAEAQVSAPAAAVSEQSTAAMGGEGGGAPVAAPAASMPEISHEEQAPPAAASAAEIPASPFVFVVTAAEKDTSHPFYGIGTKHGFVVNGIQGKPLVLVRGKTYTFKVDTGVQHDFYFSLTGVGWGGTAYTAGVEGQFIYKGVATLTPGAETPALIYYACRNHKNMGGKIYVVNPGEENLPLAELEARIAKTATPAAGAAAGPAQTAVTRQQVDQKLQFADMYINQSDTAKRIKDSGNSEAVALLESSRGRFASAKEAYARAGYAESLALVDDALRLMSDAARVIPKESQLEGQRRRFDELMRGTRDYEAAYQRNYDALVAKKGKGSIESVDLNGVHLAMEQAQTLADDGQYPQAIAMLTETQTTLTTALTRLLDSESITYDLTFDSPKEQYEHELSRYHSYEELLPLAVEQKQPPKQSIDMMNQLVDRANEIRKLSEPEAAKGNYEEAILMLQGATDHLERALKLVGVR